MLRAAVIASSLVLCCGTAAAQPADCVAEPIGPSMPIDLWIGINGRPGLPSPASPPVPHAAQTQAQNFAQLQLGAQPTQGTLCGDGQPLPSDVLHGNPAPRGLLQGNGPHDVLHDRYVPQVTVTPVAR